MMAMCADDCDRTNTYANLIPNRSLCSAYAEIMAGLDSPQVCNIDGDPAPGSYSTDMGTSLPPSPRPKS